MMQLHLDRPSFRVLIENVHKRTGYRMDVLEKDYYVTLVLQELAQKQANGLKAYFKGGTALYKALKSIRRFSEDIDLSVDITDCSRTQGDKRLRQATKEYDWLARKTSEQDISQRSRVVTNYTYAPEMEYDQSDPLQRFGQLKIEADTFSISEPFAALEIAPLLYDAATDEQKEILRNDFAVQPFSVQTMTIERIFIDKLFAAEAYTRDAAKEHRAFDAAKHIYDLCVLAQEEKVQRLMKDKSALEKLLAIRMKEEMGRLDGIPGVSLNEFTFFRDAFADLKILDAYKAMQNRYVLHPADRINVLEAVDTLFVLAEELSVPMPVLEEMPLNRKKKDLER